MRRSRSRSRSPRPTGYPLQEPIPWDARAPTLSARAAATRLQVLELLGPPVVHTGSELSFLPRAQLVPSAVSYDAVLRACQYFRVTLLEIESMVLPPWSFNCAFPDRVAFFDYVGPIPLRSTRQPSLWTDPFVGAAGPLSDATSAATQLVAAASSSSSSSCSSLEASPRTSTRTAIAAKHHASGLYIGRISGVEFPGPCGLTYCSARWAELLDGTILARLMTDGCPTEVMSGIDPGFAQVVLAALRCVPWAPAHHWIYPRRCRERLVFLSWVGRCLGLQPTWTLGVLPFLALDTAYPRHPRPANAGSPPRVVPTWTRLGRIIA